MAKDKKNVTNAMRLLNASKIKYETVEYEADEVGEHFGEAIAEMTGIPAEKSFKTLVARGDKTGIMVSCIAVNHEVDLVHREQKQSSPLSQRSLSHIKT